MTDRKKFLELCQKNAVFPKSEKVLVGDAEYFPQALKIWFDKKGETQNTAILIDKSANSVLQCRLSEVSLERKEG